MLRTRIVIATLLIQTLSFSPISYANFDKAMKIYNAKNFYEAKKSFEALSAIGDRSSLFTLGVMHQRGEAFEKNSIKAYVLMKIANDGLDDESYTQTANSIFGGFDDSQKKKADELFIKINPIYNISKISGNIFPKPLNDEDCPPEATPIRREPPRFPYTQLRAGRFGVSIMEFTISPEGYPRDITVKKSTNENFTKASVAATKKYLYKSPLDGQPIYGHRVAITYKIRGKNGEAAVLRTTRLAKQLNKLKKYANSGNTMAQYHYASDLSIFKYFKSYLKEIDLQYKTANEWFAKSAKSGLPEAQYELGRNMLKGRGCEVDVVNGFKWISAAAIGGYSPAQKTLAQSALLKSQFSFEKSLAVIGWLRNAAQSKDFAAKILLAWELSTSNEKEIRDGGEALTLLDLEPENYFDEVRVIETKAAAYAEIGDFRKAIRHQKKAARIAKKLDWSIALISERLVLYKQKKAYRGPYY